MNIRLPHRCTCVYRPCGADVWLSVSSFSPETFLGCFARGCHSPRQEKLPPLTAQEEEEAWFPEEDEDTGRKEDLGA